MKDSKKKYIAQFSQFQQFRSSNSVSSNHLKNLQVAVLPDAHQVRMSFNGDLTVEEFRDPVFFSNLTHASNAGWSFGSPCEQQIETTYYTRFMYSTPKMVEK